MSHRGEEEAGEEVEEEAETDHDHRDSPHNSHNGDSDETDLDSDLEPIILNKKNTTNTTTASLCTTIWKEWQMELVRDNLSKLWGLGWKSLEDTHETFVQELLGKLNDGRAEVRLTRKQLYDKVRRLRDGTQLETTSSSFEAQVKNSNVDPSPQALTSRNIRGLRRANKPTRSQVASSSGKQAESFSGKREKVSPPQSHEPKPKKRRSSSKPCNIAKRQKPLSKPESEDEGVVLRHQRDLLQNELDLVIRKHQAIYASLKEAQTRNDDLLNRIMVLTGERNAARNALKASTAEEEFLLDDHLLAQSMVLNLPLAEKGELVKMVLDLTAERDATRNELKAITAEKEGLLKENRALLTRLSVFQGVADTLTQTIEVLNDKS